jgi:hypothetical protein
MEIYSSLLGIVDNLRPLLLVPHLVVSIETLFLLNIKLTGLLF